MKKISWFLSFLIVLGTEAWFLQPNKLWSFEWEPFLAWITSIGAFIAIERNLWKSIDTLDIELFKKIYAPFEDSGVLSFFKNHDFGGAFLDEQTRPLESFVLTFREVNRKFSNKKLEAKKCSTLLNAEELYRLLATHSFPLETNLNIRKIYPDQLPEKNQEVVKQVNDSASKFYKSFSDFIYTAHEELKVPL